MGDPGQADEGFQVGPVAVRTDAVAVEAFAAALGMGDGFNAVPLTFAIRWLSIPEVHDAIVEGLGLQQELLVQRSQSFHYRRRLELGREYRFVVGVRRHPAHAELITLRATVEDCSGGVVILSETGLCLLGAGATLSALRRLPPLADSVIPDLRVGPVGPAQTRRYALASLDNNPIHSDLGATRAIGMDRPIVHGMLVLGQFERALVGWRRDLRVSRLHGTFVQPLPIDTPIVVSSRVANSSFEGNAEHLVLRLVARTEGDVAICVGEVEAHVTAAIAS